jgi:hypothetical protein
MNILIYPTLFLIGLVLASFLTALMYRIDKAYKYPDIFHLDEGDYNIYYMPDNSIKTEFLF